MPPLDQSYRELPLTQGQVATVDAEDFEFVAQWKWCAYWNSHTRSFYAIRSIRLPDGRTITVYMHRQLLGLHKGNALTSDHENHDTLDNRRGDNLRLATNEQNIRNRGKMRSNTSGFKGVTARGGRYCATIWTSGKNIRLGSVSYTHLDVYKRQRESMSL